MAIIGGDQGKAGESKGSGRKADDLRLSCLCLLLLYGLSLGSVCLVNPRGDQSRGTGSELSEKGVESS